MNCVYELVCGKEKYNYVSLFQSHIASSFRSSLQAGIEIAGEFYEPTIFMNSVAISSLFESLMAYEHKASTLVWDASHMKKVPIHDVEDKITRLFEAYQQVIFLLPSSDIANDIMRLFQSNDEWNTTVYEEGSQITLSVRIAGFTTRIFWYDMSVEKIRKDIEKDIAYFIFSQTTSRVRCEPVFSSNIYANRYFNAKRLLQTPTTFNAVIFQLVEKINHYTHFGEHSFDAFVCASVNGACIASAVAAIIKKPVIFLRNVGPDMTVRDKYMTERIKPGKKYVYIFDFMCMGTEYQRTKMLCALRRAHLVYCAGIAHYRKPLVRKPNNKDSREHTDIDTIFDINAFTKNKNYYYCTVDRLRKLKKQK